MNVTKSSGGRIPIKMWLDDMEEGAWDQVVNLSCLPFAFSHIAIMPDAHLGYGMPIGGVLATKSVVIPNAVGVDIGCGMCATRTDIRVEDLSKELLLKIMSGIRGVVPVGRKWRDKEVDEELMPEDLDIEGFTHVCTTEWQNARRQLGTLGGGNHFIELQKDGKGCIWIMIHSGSRNMGKKVADYYNKEAQALNDKYHTSIPKHYDLAFIPLDAHEAECYLSEMEYCVRFAKANRHLILEKVKSVLETVVRQGKKVHFDGIINVAHNYASVESHFGEEVVVHRKGATAARANEIGIIPGSQGTASYIVRGKGNKQSFESCSHGAGRKMGRKAAQRELDLEKEQKRLNDLGVIHSVRGKKDLDEAAGAYKDIDVVMANQSDLVDIVWRLTPLAVIKG